MIDNVISVEDSTLPKPNYEYVTTEEAARKAINYIDKFSEYALDTETTSLDPYEAKWSLLQIGVQDKNFVFDVRYDTIFSEVHPSMVAPILQDKSKLKLVQNAAYDMQIIKVGLDFYLENVYDTMLSEQLMNLGLYSKAGLDALVKKYLGLHLPKEPRGTFSDYNQKFQPYQLEYATNDVVVLPMIKELQFPTLDKEGLLNVADLEFRFLKPLCEMELNGIKIDANKWSIIMDETDKEREYLKRTIQDMLMEHEDQQTLFGVSMINVDSNQQLKKSLKKYGLDLESTDVSALEKHMGLPIIDALLDYRKANKLISTYADSLLAKINKHTGNLHTSFKQMVSTGRMSSSNPNLQNIPRKQKYRSCFVAKEGCSLITADMSGAELRILGNLSRDPVFIDAYASGQDLHTRTASEIFGVSYTAVTKDMRNAAKSINFGLVYGMSPVGLSARLKITKKEAEMMINKYFQRYVGVKKYLDKAAKDAVRNRYTRTVSGRKRYYNMPPFDHPDRKKIQGGIERQGMNAGIQGANSDTIKEAMCLLYDRLKGYPAKILLTVHDEIVTEVEDDCRFEVAPIIEQAIKDGFARYFDIIPMETDAVMGKCWLKGKCEAKVGEKKCGHNEMTFVPDSKYGTKLVCKKCGAPQE